jgi:hypothetical protein
VCMRVCECVCVCVCVCVYDTVCVCVFVVVLYAALFLAVRLVFPSLSTPAQGMRMHCHCLWMTVTRRNTPGAAMAYHLMSVVPTCIVVFC